MMTKRFLGLLLIPTLTALAASVTAAQVSPAAGPCGEARRIAESRPCLAGAADCAAAQRWQQVFGPPGGGLAKPELTGTLPVEVDSRLPDKKLSLKESEPLRSVLARLAAAGGIDLVVDSRISGDFRAEPGTLPLREAWRKVLGTAGLAARSAGGRVLVTRDAGDRGDPGTGPRIATGFNCPTR
jgi:hypothetical protein